MLIIGIPGTELLAHERKWIEAPIVSGVILFKRNFTSRVQVTELIAQIRALRPHTFLISIDQEGGPVQRFREGFTRLPALARIGEVHDRDAPAAIELAARHAWLMATEMRAIDIDMSYAPVLDLKRGNRVIADRAFHRDPAVVAELGQAYVRSMRLAGMAATIKHFPGHGTVLEDTHIEDATDPRSLEMLRNTDLVPFAEGIAAGAEAVMMGHVAYPAVDALPAGYSRTWIRAVLRGEYGFRGVIFSDDISMAAAHGAGGIGARISAHVDAGCELVLVCKPEVVAEAIQAHRFSPPCDPVRLASLRGAAAANWDDLMNNPQRQRFLVDVLALESAAAPA
jgi:beta-N-acetylhexosaminidase